jgi:hypothetical protein
MGLSRSLTALAFAIVTAGCGGTQRTTVAPMVAPPEGHFEKDPHASNAAPEVYVGAVGGLPVRATLTRTPTRIEGRWVYEGRGSAEGLALEGTMQEGSYDLRETTNAGELTGKLSLVANRSSLEGAWTKPDGSGSLPVLLTPEIRAREGDNVIRARRILVKDPGPPVTVFAGFVPEVDGPAAARLSPNLTLMRLLGTDEKELGPGFTSLGFDVVFHDPRYLTVATYVGTMGAYPSGYGKIASFVWETGARIGAGAFRRDKRAELVRLLDARVHAAWRAKKAELMKGPTADTTCGPDVANNFMPGDGPSFSATTLDDVHVESDGVEFGFDFDFPHVVQACTPTVDLHLPWAEVGAYVDPNGPLGAHATR